MTQLIRKERLKLKFHCNQTGFEPGAAMSVPLTGPWFSQAASGLALHRFQRQIHVLLAYYLGGIDCHFEMLCCICKPRVKASEYTG
jgi:hypothetical protein